MRRVLFLSVATIVFFYSWASAAHKHLEKEYQEAWCAAAGGTTEYRLDDGTRVDCLTDEYAIEFDFAPKWAEAIGQALYYSIKTGKKPGVVLIMEKQSDERYAARLESVRERCNFAAWKTASRQGMR